MSFSDSGSIRPAQLGAYAELFERMGDPTFLLDPISYVILAMNPAAQKRLGDQASKLWGRSLLQLVTETQRKDFGQALRVAMRRENPQRFQTQWQFSTQDPAFSLEIVACPIRLERMGGTHEVLQLTARLQGESKSSIISSSLHSVKPKKKVS